MPTGSRLWFQSRYMEFWNYSHRASDRLCTLSPLPSHEGEHCGCYHWMLFHQCVVLITACEHNLTWSAFALETKRWIKRKSYFYLPQHFFYSFLLWLSFPHLQYLHCCWLVSPVLTIFISVFLGFNAYPTEWSPHSRDGRRGQRIAKKIWKII